MKLYIICEFVSTEDTNRKKTCGCNGLFYPFPVWLLLDSANLKLSAKKKKMIIRAN